MNVPPFATRWLVSGNLVTRSELHLGDGGAARILDRAKAADKTGDQPSIASDAFTLCTDHLGRAYVPGSGIKGALRELVSDGQGHIDPAWRDLFGSDQPDTPDAVGGKLEFRDAFHCGGSGEASHQPDPKRLHQKDDLTRPWWNDARKTAVAVSVSLDRRTRTAKENLLYHLEYVPQGEKFAFEIAGDNLSVGEVGGLLALLDRLNGGTATLGARASNGWGRVGIEDLKIHCLDRKGMEEWKKDPVTPPRLAEIDAGRRDEIDLAKEQVALPRASDLLTIHLALTMESPWLVRDPRQRERSDAAKRGKIPEAQKPRDAVPIHDESGNAFVPSKSLRGALRARAEMILRTLDFDIADHPGDIRPKSTKGGGDVVAAIREMPDLAAKLFGLGGWLAPLEVPRLTQAEAPAEVDQEFVAIDRFTGGAAEHLKFNATLAGMTTLTGTLTVDLVRLRMVDEKLASLGLLALVLRDLAEGDIPIGSGSAKGQGFCRATVTWGGRDLFAKDGGAGGYLNEFHQAIPKVETTAAS